MSAFARRRDDLMAMMGEGAIAILAAAPVAVRSRDTEFPYRQDSDFYYLTGFTEPQALLALIPGRQQGQVVMFCRERDATRELWDGRRAGPEGLVRDYGIDDAFPIDDIDDILPGLMENRDRVYYAMGKAPDFDQQMMKWLNQARSHQRNGGGVPEEFIDLNHLLHEMRLFKRADEIKTMRRAGQISAEAHIRAMQFCQPKQFEYQLQAEIEHHFAANGARYPAYSSIVGSGANGCILHYHENSARMRSGDLVLIDAGCEFNYYAADITRTFPVNGKFSGPQRDLYEVVLAAQKQACDAVKPGVDWDLTQRVCAEVITEGLQALGILKGDVSELLETKAYSRFYMHRAGHWLGLDVHDVGDYKIDGEWRVLEPGMVLTIEPGIYIPADCKEVDAHWRGIGIRIEDDMLVTKRGGENLTAHAPREIADIEALMAAS